MKIEELQQWIKQNLFTKTGTLNTRKICKDSLWIKTHFPEKYNQIIQQTDFFSTDTSISKRLWHIYNNKLYLIKCLQCKEIEPKFMSFKQGYNTFCSEKCSANCNTTRNKSRKTKKDKYGNETYNNREKNVNTVRDRYGMENVFQLEDIKDKSKQTSWNKYGTEFPQQSDYVKNKIVMSNLINRGVTSPFNSDDVQLLRSQTMIKKYGVINPSSNAQIQKKKRDNCIKKYGVEHHTQKAFINVNDLNKEYIQEHFIDENNNFKLHKFQQYFNCASPTAYRKLNSLGIKYEYVKISSDCENQIVDFLQSYGIENIIRNTRDIINPLELDIYLPDYNLAIEHNGLYYHGELTKPDRNYHLNKTNLCNDKGIQLIHIFEHQWKDLFIQDIFKSMILNKLNKSLFRYYARKCSVEEIDNKTKNNFLNDNHIQGQCQSSKNLGLYYEGGLISLMTFSKSRFNKKYEYELLRFCNKKYTSVVGAASRLLKHFVKNHTYNIITYADRTYSDGGLYETLGFEKEKVNAPSYHYYKHSTLNVLNRLQCQKKKLHKLIEYDDSLTEWQNMMQNGYDRYWDCGTYVYIYEK